MRNIILFFSLLTTLSCTIIENTIDGSQKIRIRVWQNRTPDILATLPSDVLGIDINDENVLNFDMTTPDNETIYLAYTTDRHVESVKYPTNTIPASLRNSMTPDNKIFEYQTVIDSEFITTIFWREVTAGGATIIQGPTIHTKVPNPNAKPRDEVWVWLRMFKGTVSGTANNLSIQWEKTLANIEPMKISEFQILNLPQQPNTIAAISNDNTIIVFNDPDRNNTINFLSRNVFNRSFTKLSQLNSWVDGNEYYLSAIGDRSLVTGYYKNLAWIKTYDISLNQQITEMQVVMGLSNPYGLWYDDATKLTSILMYRKFENESRRWLEVDNIRDIELPRISSTIRTNLNGSPQELVYLGGVDIREKFFQLFGIEGFQSFFKGPIITGWNERYDFAANELNQVLYVRVNFDQELIFAGLNALSQWDPIQISAPPPVRVHTTSLLEMRFVRETYPLTIFKQQNGSIYVLGGAS